MQTNGNKYALTVLVLFLVLGLSACSSKDEKKSATQVAAKVNAEEISVHQINFVLSRSNASGSITTPEQAAKVRREILDKLVDQQLAVEQALDKKLDRSPDVVMALDAARREILARAYVEQLVAGASKPTAAEAKTYFSEHPQLFAERRVFNMQEIVAQAGSGELRQLREMVAAGKSMEEIANWLKSKDIKFSGGSSARPAEQIPLEVLPKVHALKDGQGLVLENGPSVTVLHVVASQSSPIAEAVALPRIQQYLGNQRAGEAVAAEFKRLKAKAKVSYQGDFADSAAVPAVVAAPTPAPSGNTPIEKGVASLK